MKLIIHLDHVQLPIPARDMDWRAIDDNYEPGCPMTMGMGATKWDAVRDLIDQLEDREEACQKPQPQST